jgi:hypothetical protein
MTRIHITQISPALLFRDVSNRSRRFSIIQMCVPQHAHNEKERLDGKHTREKLTSNKSLIFLVETAATIRNLVH